MRPRTVLLLGTRSSALAIRQSEWARMKLLAAGHGTERVEIKTTGDIVQNVPLSKIGTRALFTKQIDEAMLDGKIDLAVHSLKDLPTTLPDGIAIAAVAPREDPSDALVGRGPLKWDTLPDHAMVGTSSLRRRAQLLHVRPDLEIVDLRGNVDSRLAKLDDTPDWSAIVLASAGLMRLGQAKRIGQRLPWEVMLPAVGQGALAITARSDDEWALSAAKESVHHHATALAVAAERAFLRRLEGGCQVPVAALAGIEGERLTLRGRVASLGGERWVDGSESGSLGTEAQAESLGVVLAERLLGEGAAEILVAVRASAAPTVAEP